MIISTKDLKNNIHLKNHLHQPLNKFLESDSWSLLSALGGNQKKKKRVLIIIMCNNIHVGTIKTKNVDKDDIEDIAKQSPHLNVRKHN